MSIYTTGNKNGKYRDLHTRNDLINYICSPSKTTIEYCGYAVTDPNNPVASMDDIALEFNKTTGVQARHFILAFMPGEILSPAIAYLIGQEFAAWLGQEYQVVFAVHLNTDHIHIHFVTNAISYIDGHRYRGTKAEHYAQLNCLEQILHRYGLSRPRYVSSWSSNAS